MTIRVPRLPPYIIIAAVTSIILYVILPPYSLTNYFDFKEYWAAYIAYCEKLNSYDPLQIVSIQKTIISGVSTEVPLMMWNPPWILPCISLLMTDDYLQSLSHWILFSILIVAVGAGLLRRTLSDQSTMTTVALTMIIVSGPLLWSMASAQLGAILLLAGVLLYRSFITHSNVELAFALILFSVKPHILTPLLPALGIIILQQQRISAVIFAALGIFILAVLSLLQVPDIFFYWIEAISQKKLPLTPSIYEWKTSSFADMMFLFTERFSDVTLSTLRSFFLCLGALILPMIFRYCRSVPTHYVIAAVLPLCVFCSPYSWVFDYTVFSITLTAMFELYKRGHRLSGISILMLLVVQIPITYHLIFSYSLDLRDFAWFPLMYALLGIVWLISLRATASLWRDTN